LGPPGEDLDLRAAAVTAAGTAAAGGQSRCGQAAAGEEEEVPAPHGVLLRTNRMARRCPRSVVGVRRRWHREPTAREVRIVGSFGHSLTTMRARRRWSEDLARGDVPGEDDAHVPLLVEDLHETALDLEHVALDRLAGAERDRLPLDPRGARERGDEE